jgi:hypothetical protein
MGHHRHAPKSDFAQNYDSLDDYWVLGLARPRIAFLLFRVSSSLKSSKSILT